MRGGKMGRQTILTVIISLALLLTSFTQAAMYGGGSGDPNDPYQIWTPEQMNTIGTEPNDWDNHFKLMDDIDMSSYTGTQYNIIGNNTIKFTGTFDGNGYIIRNLTITAPSQDYIGLFGYLGSEGQINNLGVENVNITGHNCVGGLVGGYDGTITSCYTTGSVIGTSAIGGLVGRNFRGTITSCYATGTVNSTSPVGAPSVGGLVGYNNNTITSCYATNSVSGFQYIGGLVGFNDDYGTITSCYATGSASSTSSIGAPTGGLVGLNHGAITTCYATGSVSSTSFPVGGLVGLNYGTITTCYATGSVSSISSAVGGLVGVNYGGTITTCYATGSVIGTSPVGGLVGSDINGTITSCFWDIQTSGLTDGVGTQDPDPSGVIGKMSAEMKTHLTFTSVWWDFSTSDGTPADWQMPNNDYPHLNWEIPYGGGNGTVSDPYEISSVEDFMELSVLPSDWDKYFILTENIDLDGYVFNQSPIASDIDNTLGNDFQGIAFTGSFDGNRHMIVNLLIEAPDQDFVGLFGLLGNGGLIKNLAIVDASIQGREYIGGLVGENYYGTITSSYIKGNVNGDELVGGLIGWNYGTISLCYSRAIVDGSIFVGGLVGWNWYGKISFSYVAGPVNGNEFVGGLIGWNYHGVIDSCFWDTQVSGQIYGAGYGQSGEIRGKTTTEMMIQVSRGALNTASMGAFKTSQSIFLFHTVSLHKIQV
jgi:hypothetical protein